MRYVTLTGTEEQISAITLGTWVFGGDMWGGAREEESVSAVKAALDNGVTSIDTAPIYGTGLSETVVGKAIRGRRDNVFLVTKCGLVKSGGKITNCLKPFSVEREVDDSLRRLQTDRIDLYLCHWPDPDTPLEETLQSLMKIRGKGKIRHIGLSNYPKPLLEEAGKSADIRMLQAQYSLMERGLEKEDLPYCRSREIGVMTYGVLGGGILSGKYITPKDFERGDARSFFYKFYKGESFERARKLMEALKKMNRPLNQTAVNWVRQQSGVTTVIVGCRNEAQVKDNLKALEWELSTDELEEMSRWA